MASTRRGHPAGTTAVASREHNRISTATALAQVGLGWPEALAWRMPCSFETMAWPAAVPWRSPRGPHGRARGAPRLGVTCAVFSNDDEEGIDRFLAQRPGGVTSPPAGAQTTGPASPILARCGGSARGWGWSRSGVC